MTQPDAHELLVHRSNATEATAASAARRVALPGPDDRQCHGLAARESRLGALAETRRSYVWPTWSGRPQPARPASPTGTGHSPGQHDALQNHRTLVETLRQVTLLIGHQQSWGLALNGVSHHSRQTSTQKDNHELHPPGRTARLAGQDPRLHRRTGHPARERPPARTATAPATPCARTWWPARGRFADATPAAKWVAWR